MIDKFSSVTEGLNSPPSHLVSISPDDTTDIPVASRGVNVAGAGSLRVTTVGGDTETIHVAAGIVFPLRVQRIWATGTTATGIVVMY